MSDTAADGLAAARRPSLVAYPSRMKPVCGVVLMALASGALGGCHSSTAPPLDGGPTLGGRVACTPGQGFTACVPGCVSTSESVGHVAPCDDVGHYFYCEEPYVPAASCPAGTWSSGPSTACGPPVQVNGCACLVCTGVIWTCRAQPCADAGTN
jgi:hypothetical protein